MATASPRLPRRTFGLTVRRGMTGSAVRTVQRKLASADMGTRVDGQYGERTEEDVRFFQAHHRLQEDGVVGRQTMAKLNGEPGEVSPGPLRAHHARSLGLALGRRGGGRRRQLKLSGEDNGNPLREIAEAATWETFSRECAEAFMPGGGGGGETSFGAEVEDADGDYDGSPDYGTLPPGTGTMGTPSARVRLAQRALKDAGHDPGAEDGVYGPKTVGAVKSFQMAVGGLRPHGTLDGSTLEALDAASNTALVESMRTYEDRKRMALRA